MKPWAECLTGGLSASCACFFSNPLEVVKTRMQLQGELQAVGTYKRHYRNVFHAFYTIGKVDGPIALQKGLVPGVMYQFIMNGIRLGTYQQFHNSGFTKNKQDGSLSYGKCMLAGAISGCIGAFVSSPTYMMKTQLQARANAQSIAVGTQHQIENIWTAYLSIYRNHGISGLWRGVSAAMLRVTVGSAAQLSSFSKVKEYVSSKGFFEEGSIMVPIVSSMTSSITVVLTMTPFDVVSTRMYNQGVCKETGRGLLYNNAFDVFRKIFNTEGMLGFYKGIGAHYFRVGPHTILNLVFWDTIRKKLDSKP